MRNLLIFVFIFILGLAAEAQVQSQIEVVQYKVIVDRTVKRESEVLNCFSWTSTISGYPSSIPAYTYGTFCNCSGTNGPISHNYLIGNPNCSPQSDLLRVNFYKSGVLQFTNINPIALASLTPGNTVNYTDTVYFYGPQFDITSIESKLSTTTALVYPTASPGAALSNVLNEQISTFIPSGVSYDETQQINAFLFNYASYSASVTQRPKYTTSTRVRVFLNNDPVLTLPSNDTVTIQHIFPAGAVDEGNVPYIYHPRWQYSLFPFTDWLSIPTTLIPTGTRGDRLKLSGYSLLGNDYINHLNETVLMRDGAVGAFNINPSEHKAFILRLSSPHITSIAPTHLNCFERNEGSLKIKFDRQLITGERLNILLFDTLNRVNYSALNLDHLEADSSYTWPNELRAGVYFVSLIGKYAKGIPYDLYVNNRVDTVRVYKALNSINFEDGFNTTAAADTFDAATSFDEYSIATFTASIKHFNYQELTQPTQIKLVSIAIDSNVFCKGTAAGVITVRARGGLELGNNKKYYKYSLKHQDSAQYSGFTNFTETTYYPGAPNYTTDIIQRIRGIRAGNYLMHLRDTVDCFARDSVGNEVTYAFTITEPVKSIGADFLAISPITSVDSSNGQFNIKVTGGTQFPTTGANPSDEAYIAKLYDSTASGLVLLQDNIHYSDTTTVDSVYNLKTPFNLHAGKYILKLYDRSYNSVDPFNAGCFYELRLPFVKPDTLKVKIAAQHKVTCYEQKDATLKATATGGIPNDSTRYQFAWYRIPAPGQSIPLPGTDTTIHLFGDSIIAGLGAGTYKVQITDKYNNKKSDTFVVAQPAVMQLNFSTTPATCYSSFNGSMSVVVTGGTPKADTAHLYNYEWSNGALTRVVNNVAGGRYLLVVRDSMGCIAHDTVEVTAPVRVIATHTITPITCYNVRNGIASVSVTGGAPPYTYLWSNGATTSTVTGLKDTTYWYRAMDSNGCFDTDTITLSRPDTILVNLGPDRKMCLGQILRLDGTVAGATMPLTYNWQSNHGFTANTANVSITDSARYILSVTDPARGCTLRDTIKVTRIDSLINTDFIVSTQAYKNENVLLVNLSKPYPQDSVLWIIPQLGNTVQLLNQSNLNAQVLFADTGRYPITMKVYYRSGCIDDSTKYVNVIAKDNFGNIGNQANAFLKLYALIVPNPNPGTFEVQLTFSEATTAKLRLINTLTNHVVDTRQVTIPNTSMFPVNYSLGNSIVNGVYVLLIETPKGSFVAKVVILH
jgi:SprB repeat